MIYFAQEDVARNTGKGLKYGHLIAVFGHLNLICAMPEPPLPARKHVALLVETSIDFGRGVLRGIARYQQEHQRWSVFVEQRELGAAAPDWIDRWQGDGIITRSDAANVLRTGIPTVGLYDNRPGAPGLPMILNDNRTVGELAAEHLLDRGFRSFAFYGAAGEFWSQLRLSGVQATLAGKGCRLAVFGSHARSHSPSAAWEEHQEQLADWIAELERPVGLIACNDIHGLRALDACRRRDLAIPEQVAVIGADDDAELCELSDPPLSSVAYHPEQVGYEAAATLDKLMSGQRVPTAPRLVSPLGVVARQSTDVTAIDDPDVARALNLIRHHACDGLSVASLVRKVAVSRRTLELRFRKQRQRSLHEEIQRTRLDRARLLLATTDLPVTVVSDRVGFHQPARFSAVFKQQSGCSPTEYRRSATAGQQDD